MRKLFNKNIENSIKTNTGSYTIFKEDRSFQILKLVLDGVKEKYNLSASEILSLIEEKPVSKEILIPVSVFESKLSALEAVCKYLKEELELNYNKIALLLNRSNRTIWITYNKSARKVKERLVVKESKFFAPVSIFAERKLSVLETIVSYLKEKFELRYSEIAALLNRDERNIWAIYNRAIKKKR